MPSLRQEVVNNLRSFLLPPLGTVFAIPLGLASLILIYSSDRDFYSTSPLLWESRSSLVQPEGQPLISLASRNEPVTHVRVVSSR